MTPATQLDVVVAGDLFIDLVMTGFASLPHLGEEGFATHCRREAGGGASNTASGLARLGLRAAVFGVAGNDAIDWLRARFEEHHVDTSMLQSHPSEPTAITVAISTPADRIFYTYYGANIAFQSLLERRETWSRFTRARHVHFGYPVPPALLAALADWLHQHHIGISIDVGWQEAWLDDPATLDALRRVDWFLPNEHEAARMTGESDPERALRWYRDRGISGVALKLGSRGGAILSGNVFHHARPLKVQPLDTTGAGDCFNAGFLYGLLTGMPIEATLRYANVCGALSTRASGGVAGFPRPDEAAALADTLR